MDYHMKHLRVFEAFAGYGSQAMALKRLQADFPDRLHCEFVGISEIDRYAIAAYRAVHGDTRNYGDITKINWGGKCLSSICLHTLSPAKTSARLDYSAAFQREVAHAHLYFGNATRQLKRKDLHTCLWRM